MAETSYPIQESPLGIDQWKSLMLPLGRGIIDRGGYPYRLVSRDSVTDTVTIGVPSTAPQRSEAILDGFLHSMDTPKAVSVPPVSTNTTYEIGLVYDPNNQADPNGPIELTAWVAPGDNSGGKSRLVMFRMTRQPNLALGSTSYTDERPRVVPVISVSRESQLPVNGLILVDSIAVVRTTGQLFRADINDSGVVSWSAIGATDILGSATAYATPNTVVSRDSNGRTNFEHPTTANHAATKSYVDDGLASKASTSALNSKAPLTHMHYGTDLVKNSSYPVPWEIVEGSTKAYSNTNLGSTWATVAVNSAGRFGRYPSNLASKKNIRAWTLEPKHVYNATPVKYEDKESGDTRVGFVADAYTTTIPEMVQFNPDTGEVIGFNYFLFCVAQQVAIRDLHARNQTLEHNLTEVLALLGLNTDDTGRVITTDGNN